MPLSPTKRRAQVHHAKSIAGCNPNTVSPACEVRKGRSSVAHYESKRVGTVCWESDQRQDHGRKTAPLKNDSSLRGADGTMCGKHEEVRYGRRPSPVKKATPTPRVGIATGTRKYESTIQYASCEPATETALSRGKNRSHSPCKPSTIGTHWGSLSHDKDADRASRRAHLTEERDPAVQTLPSNAIDSMVNKRGRGSPQRPTTAYRIISPADLETTKERQQVIAERLRARRAPVPDPSLKAAGLPPTYTPHSGKRYLTGEEARNNPPPQFVSTYRPQADRSVSPTKRVSITGSPRRGVIPYHSTARLLAWD